MNINFMSDAAGELSGPNVRQTYSQCEKLGSLPVIYNRKMFYGEQCSKMDRLRSDPPPPLAYLLPLKSHIFTRS
jgi:hypothetical protein